MPAAEAGVTGQRDPAPGKAFWDPILHLQYLFSRGPWLGGKLGRRGGQGLGRTGGRGLTGRRPGRWRSGPRRPRSGKALEHAVAGHQPADLQAPSPAAGSGSALPTSTTAASLYQVTEGGGTPGGVERPPSATCVWDACPGGWAASPAVGGRGQNPWCVPGF